MFDIGGTGTPRLVGWTAAGTNEAFIWLDRNQNGIVDGGSELFGNATSLNDGTRATNGFEALKEFDSNSDDVIDSSDPIWDQLMLWRDLNHDGISQPIEIQAIGETDVVGISLRYHWTGRRDSFGNTFRYESSLWLRSRGQTGRSDVRPLYDIFFVQSE